MSHKALLLYPEFPNTFFLTNQILSSESEKFGGCQWEVEHCDWNTTIDIVTKHMGRKDSRFDLICYYGTKITCMSDLEVNENEDWNHKDIALPKYYPRFFFIPYDFDIFEKLYKDKIINDGICTKIDIKDKISIDGVYTENDIKDFPDSTNPVIIALLRKRGIQIPFFSDTKKQAERIQKHLEQNAAPMVNNELYPIRVYYYSAPLTIFYLKRYPEFLPVKIREISDNTSDSEFNTYIHIYYRNAKITDDTINELVMEIKKAIFKSYVDAIVEPRMLAPMFRRYCELVPRGQFYTMKSVTDFAKAITLHCSPKIEKISHEIWGDNGADKPKEIKEKHTTILQHFKDLTSESPRNIDRKRVDKFNDTKKTAFGCMVFLLVYTYQNESEDDIVYFNELSKPNTNNRRTLSFELKTLYHSIISCLTWEYLLFLNKEEIDDINKSKRKCKCYFGSDKQLFLRFKDAEQEIIKKSFNKSNGRDKYDKNDFENLVAYIESEIERYVDNAVLTESITNQVKAYNEFNKFISLHNNTNTILGAFIKKIGKYKNYKYR